ncbi:MAG: agmatine deiminase family protein [Balneolaceae bacterium]|nr:MAG: agmatine deiminase family protein [Balneolaceae bacterium]
MTEQKPYDLGFRMPAEWEMHSATQLHWPSNRHSWPGVRLAKVREVYLNLIEALHRYEPILLFKSPDVPRSEVVGLLRTKDIDPDEIRIFDIPLNDVWARDCGPIFIRREQNGEISYAVTDWEYNAWGGKYPPYDADNALPAFIASAYHLPLFRPQMILEGGSIDTNGEGLFLTTEAVLLNRNRNPHLSREEIFSRLQQYLGAEKIIWLKNGLEGDDTDGHIDDLSRFLNKNTVLTMICEDPDDINYAALKENLEILQSATDLDGNPLNIVTLPLPSTKIEGTTADGSEHVPASYANFYLANGVVLVPLYDPDTDTDALDLFSTFFPDRDVVGIECSDLVWGQGSIHCITQQLYGIGE